MDKKVMHLNLLFDNFPYTKQQQAPQTEGPLERRSASPITLLHYVHPDTYPQMKMPMEISIKTFVRSVIKAIGTKISSHSLTVEIGQCVLYKIYWKLFLGVYLICIGNCLVSFV